MVHYSFIVAVLLILLGFGLAILESRQKGYVQPPGPEFHEDGEPISKKAEPEQARAAEAQKPEVEMYFVNPQNVEWRVRNNSSHVVESVLYWLVLIDIDQPLLGGSPPIPLRIRGQRVDFINANDI